MHTIILFAVIVGLSVTASAIKCYSCESIYESNCGEDFDIEARFKLDCSFINAPHYLENDLKDLNATACMKRIFKENGMHNIVVRSCFFGDVKDIDIGCQTDPTSDDIEQIGCHVCANEDYCNTAKEQHKTSWATQMSLIAFILVSKFLYCKIV